MEGLLDQDGVLGDQGVVHDPSDSFVICIQNKGVVIGVKEIGYVMTFS